MPNQQTAHSPGRLMSSFSNWISASLAFFSCHRDDMVSVIRKQETEVVSMVGAAGHAAVHPSVGDDVLHTSTLHDVNFRAQPPNELRPPTDRLSLPSSIIIVHCRWSRDYSCSRGRLVPLSASFPVSARPSSRQKSRAARNEPSSLSEQASDWS